MTIQEYLREFLAQIGPVSDEERQQISDYYQELICEGLERGMSEAEILAAFGSPAEAAARFREENGPGEAEKGGDAPDAAVAVPAEGGITVLDLQAQAAPIEVLPAGEGELRVAFDARPDIDIVESEQQDGVWRFKHRLRKRASRLLAGLFWPERPPTIQVLVPAGFAGRLILKTGDAKIRASGVLDLAELSLTTSNAVIELEDASASAIRLLTGNGGIRLLNLGANDLEAVTGNGRIEAEAVRGGRLHFKTSNGSIQLSGLEGDSLSAESSNGRIRAGQCSISQKTGITTSNGAIVIEQLVCPDIVLGTSNGPITGTVRGDMREYATDAGTSTAGCNVPNLQGPDRQKRFSAHTSNARIAVEFVKE